MLLKNWEELPGNMKNDKVKKYFDILYKKRCALILKRIFDIGVAAFMLVILLPVLVLISVAIKIDSKGPVFFIQTRITQYGKQFRIVKFRTMVNNAEKKGTQVTTWGDNRITRIGRVLRKTRLDELPQLLNIISGDMSFVGTRPEVIKYYTNYTDEMMATLLLPAGVTSEASIEFKDEEILLVNTDNTDEVYINKVLPEKMRYNLRSIENFSLCREFKTMVRTVVAVFRKNRRQKSHIEPVVADKNKT